MCNRIKAESLPTLRARTKMSQSELAKKMRVSTNTICRWETGKTIPDAIQLVELGRIFDCGADGIFLPFQST